MHLKNLLVLGVESFIGNPHDSKTIFVRIFFVANKIPEMARGLGRGIREFKDATKEIKKELEQDVSGTDKKYPAD